jgi:hypothetical protein
MPRLAKPRRAIALTAVALAAAAAAVIAIMVGGGTKAPLSAEQAAH